MFLEEIKYLKTKNYLLVFAINLFLISQLLLTMAMVLFITSTELYDYNIIVGYLLFQLLMFTCLFVIVSCILAGMKLSKHKEKSCEEEEELIMNV
jgi:lysylphosphatidylglycerol synthetase-like protein (DUF2156 family)